MSEFERECEEYGCSPILAQWGNVIDMLMAQTEPKNQKREGKMWEKKWSQICIESGWDNPEKISVALAPKIRDMEKRAHDKLKRHVEGEDKVKWINKRRQTKQEEEYRSEVRLWTRIASQQAISYIYGKVNHSSFRHIICKYGSFHLFTSAAMEIG